jgi:8-oxo-dGTP pyrophosphatase MutT (NUDIX family)
VHRADAIMARVDVRPAATVVVARARAGPDGSAPGIEVLVLRRSAGSRFAPGFVVFPGGVVEPGDEALAERWFGSPDEVARACAIRELAEETGLVMTRDGLVEAPGRQPGDEGLPPPPPQDVPEMARWIAPEILVRRFDARFFALPAEGGLTLHPQEAEVERAWWDTPDAVLDAAAEGTFSLMWPTMRTLQALTECRSVGDVMALRVAAEPPPGVSLPPGAARPS